MPYIWKADEERSKIELLVMPVMEGERYRGEPVYYSDVVVNKNSPFNEFRDLQGKSWAYNEPRSHSGYNVTRFYLAQKGLSNGFFSNIIEAGSHETALKMILNQDIDATAIDSTVLETEEINNPAISS